MSLSVLLLFYIECDIYVPVFWREFLLVLNVFYTELSDNIVTKCRFVHFPISSQFNGPGRATGFVCACPDDNILIEWSLT